MGSKSLTDLALVSEIYKNRASNKIHLLNIKAAP